MEYEAGQVVEVCSEKSRGWSPGFNYGSKITLTCRIPTGESFAGEWHAVSSLGALGIIAENEFRPVSDAGPVRTVTRQEIIPGTYDGVGVNVGPEGELFIEVTPMATRDPDRLERAAAVLTALAGALRDGE